MATRDILDMVNSVGMDRGVGNYWSSSSLEMNGFVCSFRANFIYLHQAYLFLGMPVIVRPGYGFDHAFSSRQDEQKFCCNSYFMGIEGLNDVLTRILWLILLLFL